MRKRELLEIPTIEFTPITLLFTGGSNKCSGTGGTGGNNGTAINLSIEQGGVGNDEMPPEPTVTPET